ncbi:MAG: hypothetical protein M1834_000336 [Cirrosporium novae-zelandiae]|nr:MAG: hypothetical protein M1834_000336 [Cirrosporium novae-zelandiae]
MPIFDSDTTSSPLAQPLTSLPFPPVTKSHILHCSYRSISSKARLIPLTQPFLDYLLADGIVLPPDEPSASHRDDITDDSFSDTSSQTSTTREDSDPSEEWRDIHLAIESTIRSLGGKVVPKLNWSAPKDATWINATNSMDCCCANDVYLLLKSSDFITHDLEQAFLNCVDDPDTNTNTDANPLPPSSKTENPPTSPIPYTLILRKHFLINPSLEFRCFVRSRTLHCLCQRDPNHYSFLPPLLPTLLPLIQNFFTQNLKDTFPDENFVFDCYVPAPQQHRRVWLIDINPWAERTDPLLFSWLEILTGEGGVGRGYGHEHEHGTTNDDNNDDAEEEADEYLTTPNNPEFRLVNCDDPEAYNFSSPQYGAHKLPKEVVDAAAGMGTGGGGGGLQEFLGNWKDVLERGGEDEEGED